MKRQRNGYEQFFIAYAKFVLFMLALSFFIVFIALLFD